MGVGLVCIYWLILYDRYVENIVIRICFIVLYGLFMLLVDIRGIMGNLFNYLLKKG